VQTVESSAALTLASAAIKNMQHPTLPPSTPHAHTATHPQPADMRHPSLAMGREDQTPRTQPQPHQHSWQAACHTKTYLAQRLAQTRALGASGMVVKEPATQAALRLRGARNANSL
jgi:hypothetical protein